MTLNLNERLAADLDASFAALVREHEAAVYTTALRVTGRRHRAEDIAAESFEKAYNALRGYSRERIAALQLRPWLVTITLNAWRNEVRRESRRPSLAPLDPSWDAPDDGMSPEDAVLAVESTRRLARLVAGLPERYRVPLVLRHVVGMSYAEIARALSCPEGTVKAQVSRALQRLHEHLAERPALEAG